MIRALFLIFEPVVAWERIAQSRRSIGFILATHLVPTLLIVAGVESWGLVTMGKWQEVIERTRDFNLPQHLGEVVTFAVVQFFLTLAVVYVAALLVQNISRSFRQNHDFRESFALVAYGLSPMFLVRLLDALPTMNPFMTWFFGIVLSLWVIYWGLPHVMQPDPTHALGLYLATAFVVVQTSAVARLPTALYVTGRMDFHYSWLTHNFPRLFQ